MWGVFCVVVGVAHSNGPTISMYTAVDWEVTLTGPPPSNPFDLSLVTAIGTFSSPAGASPQLQLTCQLSLLHVPCAHIEAGRGGVCWRRGVSWTNVILPKHKPFRKSNRYSSFLLSKLYTASKY